MQILSIGRTPNGAAEFAGRAQNPIGRQYLFFAERDGSAAVFREQEVGSSSFAQIKPNTPKALSAAIRRAIRRAVQS
jgi:hypothetical protein